jgi:four helix bundle protein
MFLKLAHTKLNVYQFSQELALECYRVTKKFPPDERFAMTQQIRRAAISVHLNIQKEVQENRWQKETGTLIYQEDLSLKLIVR